MAQRNLVLQMQASNEIAAATKIQKLFRSWRCFSRHFTLDESKGELESYSMYSWPSCYRRWVLARASSIMTLEDRYARERRRTRERAKLAAEERKKAEEAAAKKEQEVGQRLAGGWQGRGCAGRR